MTVKSPLPQPTIWRGPKDLVQQPISETYEAGANGLVVPFKGPLSVCRERRPIIGQPIAGFTDSGMKVERIEIEEISADAAEMRVHLSAPVSDSGLTTAALGEPIYEIEFCELQKPVEQHPNCGVLKADRPIIKDGRRRGWEDWADLTGEDYDDSAGGDTWNLAVYQSIREAGIDSFSTAQPVVRRTLYYFRNPSGVGSGCYERENPPGAAGAPTTVNGLDIEWLKSTDKITRQGRLRTRVTEWLGAWEWLELIYPA